MAVTPLPWKIAFDDVLVVRMSYRVNFDHLQKSCRKRCLPASQVPLDMETFHLLSRGGVKFDKRKYRDDVKLFNVSVPISDSLLPTCSRSQVEVKYFEQKCTSCAENGG